jgi:hypothetical protein
MRRIRFSAVIRGSAVIRSSAVIVPLLVVLAACGGAPKAKALLVGSPAKTAAGRTSAFAVDYQFAGISGASKPLAITAEGAFDFAERKGNVRMPLGSLGLPGLGAGTVAELLLTGDAYYVKLPGVGSTARPWIKVDLADKKSNAAMIGLDQLGVDDPLVALELLRGAASNARETGKETVRGAKTTRYHAVVEMKKALSDAPPARRPQLERFAAKLQVSQLPVDVWIDDLGRTRRLEYSVDVPGTGSDAAPLRMTSRTELFDFGTHVDVTVPPADQVTDAASLG